MNWIFGGAFLGFVCACVAAIDRNLNWTVFWFIYAVVLLFIAISGAHADTWNRCKEGTLIRIEPGPGFVCECPGSLSECNCPPLLSCIESEKETAECKRINAGLLSERDGFAALHQREAADNRRCKRNLRKCRGRK